MAYEAPAGTRIGHVHLKVSDLDRALAFYHELLGMQLMQRYGTQAAFVSAGGYHHHIGLNTWESKGGQPLWSKPFWRNKAVAGTVRARPSGKSAKISVVITPNAVAINSACG